MIFATLQATSLQAASLHAASLQAASLQAASLQAASLQAVAISKMIFNYIKEGFDNYISKFEVLVCPFLFSFIL